MKNQDDLGFEPIENSSSDDLGFEELPQEKTLADDAVDTAKGFGVGVGQGLTFGAGDEIAAGLKTAYDAPSLDYKDGLSALMERYRSNVKGIRGDIKEIEEAAPAASFAGNLVGGFVSPVNKIGMLAKGASLTKNALQGAKLGALAGFNSSEGDLLEDTGSVVLDTATGAALGGALPVGIAAAKGTAGAIKSGASAIHSTLRDKVGAYDDTMKALEYGKKGIDTTGKKIMDKLVGQTRSEISEPLVKDVLAHRAASGRGIGAIREQAAQLGYDIPMDAGIDDMMNIIKKVPSEEDRKILTNMLKDSVKYNTKNKLVIDGKTKEGIKALSPQQKAEQELLEIQGQLKTESNVLGNELDISKIDIDPATGRAYFTTKNNAERTLAQAGKTKEGVAALSSQQKAELAIENNVNRLKQAAAETGENLESTPIKFNPKTNTVSTLTHDNAAEIANPIVKNVGTDAPFTPLKVVDPKPNIYSRSVTGEAPFTPLKEVAEETTPMAMNNQDLKVLADNFRGARTAVDSTSAQNATKQLADKAGDLSKQAVGPMQPQLEAANSMYAKTQRFMEGLDDTLIDGSEVDKRRAMEKIDSFFRNVGGDADSAIMKKQRLYGSPGTPGLLDELEKINPRIAQKMRTKIDELGELWDLNKKARREGFSGLGGSVGSVGIKAGETAGLAANKVNNIISAGKKYVTTNTPEAVKDLALKLANKGNAKYSALLTNIADKPERTRNALIFSLMQRQDFRQAISEGEDDGSDK